MGRKISCDVLAAAVGMLQPFYPDLNPKGLIEFLEKPQLVNRPANTAAASMTRREAAAALGVSLNTLNRYMNMGVLRRVKISSRLVRLDAQSVRELLANGIPEVEA